LQCAVSGSVSAQTRHCSLLGGRAIAGAAITRAKVAEADTSLPEHCIIAGTVNQRTGVDGKPYAILLEMRQPATWNGRFWHQLNGGNDGEVIPALGDRPEFNAMNGTSPLARGFAVLSSDSGHQARDPANMAFGLAAGAAFGLDPSSPARLRLQRGHRACSNRDTPPTQVPRRQRRSGRLPDEVQLRHRRLAHLRERWCL
jgi:feruloyl esterase